MWKDRDGKFSQSKFWATVAYGVSTFIVVKITLQGQMTETLLLVYIATVGSVDVAKKWLTLHYGAK